MSVTSVARSATPSNLTVLLVSCVRPTMVRTSPRCTVVVGRIGMSVAVAPRVILRRKTPRVSGTCTRSISALPSSALLLTRTSTPSTGTASSSRSSTSAALRRAASPARRGRPRPPRRRLPGGRCPPWLLRWPRCGGGAAQRGARQARVASASRDAQADRLAALGDLERPHFPAPPGRAGAAQLLDAALLLFVVLARRLEIDAEQLGARAPRSRRPSPSCRTCR